VAGEPGLIWKDEYAQTQVLGKRAVEPAAPQLTGPREPIPLV
jgi:hypothetical protein